MLSSSIGADKPTQERAITLEEKSAVLQYVLTVDEHPTLWTFKQYLKPLEAKCIVGGVAKGMYVDAGIEKDETAGSDAAVGEGASTLVGNDDTETETLAGDIADGGDDQVLTLSASHQPTDLCVAIATQVPYGGDRLSDEDAVRNVGLHRDQRIGPSEEEKPEVCPRSADRAGQPTREMSFTHVYDPCGHLVCSGCAGELFCNQCDCTAASSIEIQPII
ncbi:hypothetical protein M427DRAFT_219903 [Gonapodya prolifera JEL478]|uniref:Uncharacterized protein n=1 Tax=Gonapodya prolifera (strain JEL478) TaxID=1344416 RepID=A0A138ZZ63_GONPJ|nr:hypothetical protein M427DRAFT_219903 [Gonapodya prolifera JEL478]|eukprot:KXS09565.1 hypothetical protein M427DRAFT_219903 [Gonapodya prolifera JEL478]